MPKVANVSFVKGFGIEVGVVPTKKGISSMAHFYGWLRGEKGKKVTHIGSETSGLNAILNGFGFGVRVSLYFDGTEDKADIYLTGGSNDEMTPVLIGTYKRMDIVDLKYLRKKKLTGKL